MPKLRLDRLLVERELAADLKEAAALVMAGKVFSGQQRLDKSGLSFEADIPLSVKTPDHPYVSRGGLKLAAALSQGGLNPKGWRCLDLGASTGGFTDCLLQHGAASVTAVDAGTNQLDFRLRKDPRVRALEKTNARTLDPEMLGGTFDFACADLSFISIDKIFPALRKCLAKGAPWVALVKPQFEAAKEEVPAGGVIEDPAVHQRVKAQVWEAALQEGLGPRQYLDSPIKGREGNKEFLLLGQIT